MRRDVSKSETARRSGVNRSTVKRYLRAETSPAHDPAADNAAAIRTYEKVGFRTVGVMREYWRSPDRTWRDGLLMDLLAREFDRA